MLLDIRKIHCNYGKLEVLRGVSLTVSRNELVSLIGANGAGKTTLLRAISGYVKATRGQIVFEDTALNELSIHKIVKMGISQVPEGSELFPNMTVEENIELGAFIRKDFKEIKREIDEWIPTLFPVLRERRRQLAATLSGGERQMVAIARGLMARPKLLMLDEPSLGLAPIAVQVVFSTIREIVGRGQSTLLVEQNAKKALEISDRTYVLETGQVSIEGKSKDLIGNSYVKEAYLGL